MAVDRALEPSVPARALSGVRGGRPPVEELEAKVGHAFADRALLKWALTHVSALGAARRGQSYERLEFLGDRVLGLVIAELLLARFPKAEEGEMSRRFAELVRKETCADVARVWDVGPHLYLGPGEIRSGGRNREAILGDVCEALIGAVFLDAGYGAASEVVRRGFADRVVELAPPVLDPKSVLQEWAQGRGLPLPLYRELGRSGPDHKPEFRIGVEIAGFEPCEASGASKRFAEQAAARAFLDREDKAKTSTGEAKA